MHRMRRGPTKFRSPLAARVERAGHKATALSPELRGPASNESYWPDQRLRPDGSPSEASKSTGRCGFDRDRSPRHVSTPESTPHDRPREPHAGQGRPFARSNERPLSMRCRTVVSPPSSRMPGGSTLTRLQLPPGRGEFNRRARRPRGPSDHRSRSRSRKRCQRLPQEGQIELVVGSIEMIDDLLDIPERAPRRALDAVPRVTIQWGAVGPGGRRATQLRTRASRSADSRSASTMTFASSRQRTVGSQSRTRLALPASPMRSGTSAGRS